MTGKTLNKLKKPTFSLVLAVAATLSAQGQTEEASAPRLQVSPSGQVLVDGALYASPEKQFFKDGMAIPEVRLGVKMKYGKWSSWIDVGFAYSKIGLRNMWIQYDFNEKNSIRAGNFIQPFGLQSTTSQSLKSTFEQPMASAPFTPGMQLGVMYTHVAPSFLSSSSFHVESAALSNIMNYPLFNQQGYSLLTRFIWRGGEGRFRRGAFTAQAGVSGGFSTPQRNIEGGEDVHDGFVMTATFPTKVTTLEAIGTTVGNSRNLFKITPELLLSYGRLALEAQYFFQQINRKNNLKAYRSQSGYVTLRSLLTRGAYGYDSVNGQVEYPKKNTLECVLSYSYCNLSDSGAGIHGGNANSFSATLNYYFNPYITGRLNYFYAHTWGSSEFPGKSLNGFQIRLMVLF